MPTRITRDEWDFFKSLEMMANRGQGTREIARLLGVSTATLYNRMRRAGLRLSFGKTARMLDLRSDLDMDTLVLEGVLVVEEANQ